MNRRAVLLAAGALLVLLMAGAGAYAYFFSGLRSAPPPLALATPSASSPSAATTATPAAGLAGNWTVAPGGQARFRVRESVAGLAAAHEAVAQSTDVSGGLTLTAAGADYQASAIRVAVGLTGLRSIDTLAGHDVSQRDGSVQRALATFQFPQAVFEAGPVTVPAAIADGRPQTLDVPGRLTLHGVTRDVRATVQVQVTGDVAQAVGRIQVDMTDFGVQPPRAPGIAPEAATTLEFQADLKRA